MAQNGGDVFKHYVINFGLDGEAIMSRTRWHSEKRSLKPGEIVLMKDKSMKRNLWPLSRVESVNRSSDGHVRSATLSVSSCQNSPEIHTFARSITYIILILANDS